MSPLGFVLPAAGLGLGALAFKPKASGGRGFFPNGGKPIIAQATLEEQQQDELEITEHPVEQGAAIADHAYKRPAEVVIRCAWSNAPTSSPSLVGQAVGVASAVLGNPVGVIAAAPGTVQAVSSLLTGNAPSQAKEIYQQLLALQASRIPFDIHTGQRSYTDMLFKSLSQLTDRSTENILMLTAVCRQVIIVKTQVVSVSADPSVQAEPEKTADVQDIGTCQPEPGTSFTAPADSLNGAMGDLQAGLSDTLSMFTQLPGGLDGLSASVAGVVDQVPGILEDAQSALSSVTDKLNLPLEIPTIPGAESLTVELSGAVGQAKDALAASLTSLPDTLTQAQSQLTTVLQQLPSVTDQLPATLAGLPDALKGIQGQITEVVRNVPSALQRVMSP